MEPTPLSGVVPVATAPWGGIRQPTDSTAETVVSFGG